MIKLRNMLGAAVMTGIFLIGTALANDGIIVAGKTLATTDDPCTATKDTNIDLIVKAVDGIIVAGKTGIIVTDFTGIIVAGSADPTTTCGIIVAG